MVNDEENTPLNVEDISDDNNDVPEYSSKSEFSKAEVVEQAVIKCVEARGQEMKPGYYNTFIDKLGMIEKVWIADARDKFMSCVDALRGLLSPEIQRDKVYAADEEKIYNQLKEITAKYEYEERTIAVKDDKVVYNKTGRKYIPLIDALVVIERVDQRTRRVIGEPLRGGWNDYVHAYKDECVFIYDQLFAALNDLVDRLQYFKPRMGY
jgi:hypothetical protein